MCKKAGRRTEEVQVLYAVKYLSPPDFVEFLKIIKELGIGPVTIGENRVQSALEKINYVKKNHQELFGDFHLMMIGPLQSNKIKKAINIFEEIQSIDTVKISKDLDSRLKIINKSMPVYIEVNISEEMTKHGFKLDQIESIMLTMGQFSNLAIKGFMTMAPHMENEKEIRKIFRKLRELADRYNFKTSMGMSHDWKIAIEEGSDMVRVGSLIFS